MANAALDRGSQSASAAYDGFDKMLIDGDWRRGRRSQLLEDRDPYNNDVLVRIPQAHEHDLDDAFAAAANAQPQWQDTLPEVRSAVLRRAVSIMEQRREEILDWLIRESSSTRIKANIEFAMARAITLESATFPARADGQIPASNIAGKENRIYRQPVGVVGMINRRILRCISAIAPLPPRWRWETPPSLNRRPIPPSRAECCSGKSTKKPACQKAF